MTYPTIDSIPVAFTPSGGWTTWPAPILAGCTEPRPDGADDIDGYWRTVEVLVALGHVQRVEQRGPGGGHPASSTTCAATGPSNTASTTWPSST